MFSPWRGTPSPTKSPGDRMSPMTSDAVDERLLASAISFADKFGGLQGCAEEGLGNDTGLEGAGEGEGNGVL